MKRILLSLFLLALAQILNAGSVEVNGIWYNLITKSQTVEVTKAPNGYTSEEIIIPDKIQYEGKEYIVNTIGEYAFDWSDIKTITIPQSITSIKDGAFYKSRNLTKVNISDINSWLNIIFDDATSNPMYYGKASLCLNNKEIKELIIPDGTENIGNYIFIGCSSIESIKLPNTVKSIGDGTFSECKNLTSINLPEQLISLGKGCFSYCEKLNNVHIPNSVKDIGNYVFSGCISLTAINIPSELKYISAGAFEGCDGLTYVDIPDNINSLYSYIGRGAFTSCSNLKTIKLGKGIKYIESKCFAYCKNIEDVYCLAKTPPKVESDIFYDSMIEYSSLYVPDNNVDIYKNTEPWCNFKTIIPLSITGIKNVTIGKEKNEEIFSLNGSKQQNYMMGINIIRSESGKVKKVFVKNY